MYHEFSAKNDSTIYNSILLRILLVENKPLEQWQIYKAIHAAIQRRGYDANLPWAHTKSGENKKSEKRALKYTKENDVELIIDSKYKYPCYYDAVRLTYSLVYSNWTISLTNSPIKTQPKHNSFMQKL